MICYVSSTASSVIPLFFTFCPDRTTDTHFGTSGKVKPRGLNKHAPNKSIIDKAFRVLHAYGDFTWMEKDGFKITSRDGQRLKTFIDHAVKVNRLTTGAWNKKTWIGFATLSRMVRAFLNHWHIRGCLGWDLVISKCLSVVLVAALGSRSGDVTRTDLYEGCEYLQWRHIDLYLEGEAKYVNLRAVVTLEFVKEYKNIRNKELTCYLRPLDDADCQHICPVALLIVHALRNGMVSGTTLRQVLDRAAAAPARRVVWTCPNLPVLPRFERSPFRCDFTGPANPSQLLRTIKEMGLISNILTRVYMHATRLGAARDLAHLPRSDESFEFSTDEIRQALGHRVTTATQGTTEMYVGGSTREFYNARAANKGKSHRREPTFSDQPAYDMVKAPVSAEEIRVWKDENEGPDRKRLRPVTIRAAIRRERLEHYRQTATPETPPIIGNVVTDPGTLASISPNKVNTTSSPTARVGKRSQGSDQKQSRASIPAGRTDPDTYHLDDGTPDTYHGDDGTPDTYHGDDGTGETFDYATIDPALLDDSELEQLQVPQADLCCLEDDIFPTQDGTMDPSEESDREGVRTTSGMVTADDEDALFEESGRLMFGMGGGEITLTAEQWIDRHARINVVKNDRIGGIWKAYSEEGGLFESTMGKYSVRGNSRDDPTPWIFYCHKTDGCTFQSTRKRGLDGHEVYCTQALVEAVQAQTGNANRVMCTWEGCRKSFYSKETLSQHISGIHKWQPKPCEDGCEPATYLYQSKSSYAGHRELKHSGRWPCHCSHPECTDKDKTFVGAPAVKKHLRTAHKITDPTEQARHMPPRPPRKQWVWQTCFREDCSNQSVRQSRKDLRVHLTSYHKMTDDDANRLIDERAQFNVVTHPTRVLGTSGHQQVARALGAEGEVVGGGLQKKRKSGEV